MRKSLNSAETQDANSKAISLWANVPPDRPDELLRPIAPVAEIHFDGESVKLLDPASTLKGVEFDPFKIRIVDFFPQT